MPQNNEPNLPPDMLMMLGRMDGKLDSLLSQTATNTGEIKDLGNRVGHLEASDAARQPFLEQHKAMRSDVDELKGWRSTVEGGSKGISMAANVGKMALGAAIGVAGFFGVQTLSPHKQVAKQELSIERTLQLPPARH